MGLRDKSIIFIRRLSVFYLLLIVLIVCFGLYYFDYIPHNRNELNKWGQRSLNQLAENFTQKGSDVKDILDSAIIDSLRKKQGSYRYLNANIPYRLDKVYPDTFRPKDRTDTTLIPFIGKDRMEQWCLQYSADSLNADSAVLVRVKDFIRPLLEGRDDFFDTYMLFKESHKLSSGNSVSFDIVYRDEAISASAIINADTLLRLQKNSDLSGVVEISISGTVYELFIRPFDFYGQPVYLAGLISKENYEKNVQSTPLTFIPYSVVFFLLICISMPFLKIFLLSKTERINAKDVMSAALSFFVGSSILVLVFFYIFINVFTKMTFTHRLDKFGYNLTADIEKEFQLASDQLLQYDSLYRTLDMAQKRVLVYDTSTALTRDTVNKKFIPTHYYNVGRVFWIDSAGNTLAKWNPFNFNSPLTNVKNLDFFRIFQRQVSTDNSFIDSTRNIIYTGKSNTTGEFQVFVVKPLRETITTKNRTEANSVNITMALFLNSSAKPVVPLGFGFCLVDQEGRILMDADEHRNLSENLLKETGNNEHLLHCMRYKNKAIIDDVQLYGQPYEMKVIPLHDQPLYLVVYYNNRLLTNNILRLLRFTLETLFYLFAALTLCIFLSALSSFFTNNKLRFKLTKINWVRYSTANKNAYAFTRIYYMCLTLLTMILSLVILEVHYDIRPLMYISLLLPFYTVLAFIFSGVPCTSPDGRRWRKPDRSILLAGLSLLCCIIAINYIALSFYKKEWGLRQEGICWFFLFQLLVLTGYVAIRRYFVKKADREARQPEDTYKKNEDPTICRNNYISSLRYAILLIGVLPSLGVLTYGFYSEKIQYKKNKLLKIARNSEERCQYLAGKVIPAYKQVVKDQYSKGYFDSLLFRSGLYLTERDTVIYQPVIQDTIPTGAASSHRTGALSSGNPGTRITQVIPDSGNVDLADEPYDHFMDNHSFHMNQDYDGYSVPQQAGEGSWRFYTTHDTIDWINLTYTNKIAAKRDYRFFARSSIQNPWIDFCKLPWSVKIFFVVLVGAFMEGYNRLVKGTTGRLFLFDFDRSPYPDLSADLLKKYLTSYSCRPEILATEADPYAAFHKLTDPECDLDVPDRKREMTILCNEHAFKDLYDCIWNALSLEEQFILYDFCVDCYTNNKKENNALLNTLMDKGLLMFKEDAFMPFNLSFRNYVLSKKENPALSQFIAERSAGGFWAFLRIPLLTIVAVVAIFTAFTQSDFTNQLTAFLTSLLALFPLILKFLENFRLEAGDKKNNMAVQPRKKAIVRDHPEE